MRYIVQEGQLSVALLLHDLNEVKEISTVFRRLGIIPHFYEDLQTFWNATCERIPSLCIVDVKKMSEGELVLCNHPAVLASKLPLVFFYTKNTEPLLVSTYDFLHVGLLKKTDDYDGPLKVILKRLNHFIKIKNEKDSLKQTLIIQNEMIEKLNNEKLTIKRIDQYQLMVKDICMQLEDYRGESDFFKVISKVFQPISQVSEFAMLELSFNGQKLISPIFHGKKFRAISSLWLGQACPNGIELFAQNMATQVALDLMGGDLVSLLIKGRHQRPDKIIFIKAENELFYNNFDWNMLEIYLNGFYASYLNILEREPNTSKKFISSFDAMSFIDQFLFGNTIHDSEEAKIIRKQDLRLIDLDLTALIDVVMNKKNNRFYWSKFEKEFINKLEIQSRTDFRVFDFSVNHLAFLVEGRDLDSFFLELKNFSTKFSYWKYFEDGDDVLSQIIKTKVTMVPLSAYAFLKTTQDAELLKREQTTKGMLDKETLAKLKTQELIWGREYTNEI